VNSVNRQKLIKAGRFLQPNKQTNKTQKTDREMDRQSYSAREWTMLYAQAERLKQVTLRGKTV